MALLHNNKKQYVYLCEHHTLGRLQDKVDTVIDDAYVSRIHAVMQWLAPHWVLRDLSSNGTWLNGTRVKPNEKYQLKQGDSIQFGSNTAPVFELIDTSAPQDALIQTDNTDSQIPTIIPVDNYHFLPDEAHPEMVLYKKNGGWFADDLGDANTTSFAMTDGSTLQFDHKHWQLKLSQNSNITTQVEDDGDANLDASVVFVLSLDEEHCNVKLIQAQKTMDLSSHSHHLLTVMLARYRANDIQNNLPAQDQGWVYMDTLSRDTGLEERHINIQIHRVRKQLADKLERIPESFIERRRGQLRFGGSSFEIIKGDKVEFSSFN